VRTGRRREKSERGEDLGKLEKGFGQGRGTHQKPLSSRRRGKGAQKRHQERSNESIGRGRGTSKGEGRELQNISWGKPEREKRGLVKGRRAHSPLGGIRLPRAS